MIDKNKVNMNKTVINARNYKILLVTIISVLILYVSSIPVSLLVDNYKPMFIPYICIIAVLILLLSIYRLFKSHILIFSYIILGLFYCFLVYSSLVVQRDMVCVTILFFIFSNPIIILDYEWRIDLITIIYSLVYMILVIIFKNKSIVFDELFNVFSTVSLCLILTHFSNKIMLENIDLKRLAEESARTDYLTKLKNRIALFEEFDNFDNSISAILMIDVDYFKKYNDTYSHQRGDDCLRLVTNEFNKISQIYPDTTFYRYGGEEFVAVIKDHFKDDYIYGISEEIRRNVESLNIEHSKSIHKIVTVSIGFSIIVDLTNVNYQKILREADDALYKAKENGRNRVERYLYTGDDYDNSSNI